MFNSDEQTIELSCDILHGDTSELNVWYVTGPQNMQESLNILFQTGILSHFQNPNDQ